MPDTHVDRLLDHLTDGDAGALPELRAWLTGSRRFRAFADAHRDKVRKKVRAARDADARLDLRAELAAAHSLLADRRIDLAYEAFGATAGGPDFTVAFRSHPALTVEVTRWRGEPAALERQLLAKLRQLPTGIANAVLVVADDLAAPPDVASVADRWRDRADAGDESFFRRHGLEGVRPFRARLGRLGGVVLWSGAAGGAAAPRVILWRNPAARIVLPDAAVRAILVALEA
ncbi:MAG TPA: hypothetical protein VHR55_05685 [Candidatus Limnocylindria bacterium]|nr:hypothetical protein [Candidatus Limnocylindria bacterium]